MNSPRPLGSEHWPIEASRTDETHWSCCFMEVGAQVGFPSSSRSSPAEGHFWSASSWAPKPLLSACGPRIVCTTGEKGPQLVWE